jgi:hypothetical protein
LESRFFFCFKSPRGIAKTKVTKQKVLLVKKYPTKISSDSESDDSDRGESDSFKSVSFSPEVEVLEIAPRKKLASPNKKFNHIKGLRTDGIKSRLGRTFINRLTSDYKFVIYNFLRFTINIRCIYSLNQKSSQIEAIKYKSIVEFYGCRRSKF